MKVQTTKTNCDRLAQAGRRRAFLTLVASIALAPLACLTSGADDDHGATKMRWDLIHITNFSPLTIFAGGQASAKAVDGSWITLTGQGTFLVNEGEGRSQAVTGGGTWETFDVNSNLTASGTYEVTGLVEWTAVEGSPIPGTIDNIGDGTLADNRGGLLVLRIAFSDGDLGSLVVSCHLPGMGPPETPETVFEGATATKGFIGYWNRVGQTPGVDGNRTLFHVLPSRKDRD